MYKDMYHLPDLKVDITFSKVLVICITIFATLIIPIQLQSYISKQTNNTTVSVTTQNTVNETGGTVAGVQTAQQNDSIDLLGLNISEDAAPYFIAGFFLMGLSLLVIAYLSLNQPASKTSRLPHHVR